MKRIGDRWRRRRRSRSAFREPAKIICAFGALQNLIKIEKKCMCIFCWPFSSSLCSYSFQFTLNMLNWCSRWYNMTAFDDFFARSRSICRCIYYLRAKWLFAQTCILIMLFEQCFKYILHDLLKTLAESLQINMYMCTCVHCTVHI